MVPPLLKLEFTQGPRDGDSLEFKPGSTIRIGRIARGNEIAIKDAGISTKHLRIVSDSQNWIIHDLGSSNGTILNSDTVDPDTPVNLSHGDTVKLGEYTSIVVNFVTDVQAQEHKLPPRPRRNNKRLAVSDPDPDPIESVQEKPRRKGRSSKQDNASSKDNDDEYEVPKRTRASKKRNLEDMADKVKELEVENEKKVNSRVGRPRKQESRAITKEEEVPEEKKGNSRVRRGKNNEKLGLNSIKLEVEDTPKGVVISEVKSRKRVTRSEQIENARFGFENVKSEDTALEEKDEKRTSRATRSKKTEIGGDAFLDLEMVLKQARKSRAKRKKMEHEPSQSIVEMEAINDDAGEEALKNCQRSDDKCDEREGDGSKRVEQVESELRKKSTLGEDVLNCTVREDGETEKLQDMGLVEEECRDTIQCKSDGAGISTSDDRCDEEMVEQGSSNKNVERVEVDLGKLELGEWFEFLEVQLPKEIIEDTEKMIEPMRSKALRVHKHIAEQREKGQDRVSLI